MATNKYNEVLNSLLFNFVMFRFVQNDD